MSAQPHPEHAPSIVPTRAHRVAAARATRLGAHCQTEDLLAFFEDLGYEERAHVFALLARAAGGRGLVPVREADPPWWTPEEIGQAERLWQDGNRSTWVRTGHLLHRKAQTARAKLVPTGVRVDGWTEQEDAAVVAPDRPVDAVLAERLGRSLRAVQSRRQLLHTRARS